MRRIEAPHDPNTRESTLLMKTAEVQNTAGLRNTGVPASTGTIETGSRSGVTETTTIGGMIGGMIGATTAETTAETTDVLINITVMTTVVMTDTARTVTATANGIRRSGTRSQNPWMNAEPRLFDGLTSSGESATIKISESRTTMR